ncbi:hypothetical protein IF2G_03146 [Cordyceps javanica]|nr:hypothetical protein IF2G_03146 [Cordyceps javanica]
MAIAHGYRLGRGAPTTKNNSQNNSPALAQLRSPSGLLSMDRGSRRGPCLNGRHSPGSVRQTHQQAIKLVVGRDVVLLCSYEEHVAQDPCPASATLRRLCFDRRPAWYQTRMFAL